MDALERATIVIGVKNTIPLCEPINLIQAPGCVMDLPWNLGFSQEAVEFLNEAPSILSIEVLSGNSILGWPSGKKGERGYITLAIPELRVPATPGQRKGNKGRSEKD